MARPKTTKKKEKKNVLQQLMLKVLFTYNPLLTIQL